MKGKIAVTLFIVVFLLIAAVTGTYLSDKAAKQSPADDGIVIPSQTETQPPETLPSAPVATVIPPAMTPTPSTPTPAPATPAPTPAPATPTPEPTPGVVIPSVEPVFTASNLGSGSFSSETGVGLNLKADWSAKTISTTQAEITISVSVNSYSLHLVAVPNAINLNLGGQYISLDAPAVDYDGTSSRNTPMASKTFTVDLAEGESTDFHLDVVWNFGGTYQQVELLAIECGGEISLAR